MAGVSDIIPLLQKSWNHMMEHNKEKCVAQNIQRSTKPGIDKDFPSLARELKGKGLRNQKCIQT